MSEGAAHSQLFCINPSTVTPSEALRWTGGGSESEQEARF